MADCIIDTNVLLVASACDPGSHFDDSGHVPAKKQMVVLDWLKAFRKDGSRCIVLDQSMNRKGSIWKEYHHKMSGQDYGLMVIVEKLQSCQVRFLDIMYDSHDNGLLPASLEILDPSDRKFVAVALMDKAQGGSSLIVNAIDSDWEKCKGELGSLGIHVEQILDSRCDEKHAVPAKSQTKRSSKTKR